MTLCDLLEAGASRDPGADALTCAEFTWSIDLRGGVAVVELETALRQVGYKAPEEIVFHERMPRTASGKIDRSQLKRMAEPRQPSAGA